MADIIGRTNRPVIVVFGCPRAGTTRLFHFMCKTYPNHFVAKLGETNHLHPCNSTTGLVRLFEWLEHVKFARAVRDPIEIAESFAYLRSRPDLRSGPTARSFSDVIDWIQRESESVFIQNNIGIEVYRYEDLPPAPAANPGRYSSGEAGRSFLSKEERMAVESILLDIRKREGYV